MRFLNRKSTQRGIGFTVEEREDGRDSSRVPLNCPPATVASSRPGMRYSYVSRRRETLSMPLPVDDAPSSQRRHTWRLPVSLDEAEAGVGLSLEAMAAALRRVQ